MTHRSLDLAKPHCKVGMSFAVVSPVVYVYKKRFAGQQNRYLFSERENARFIMRTFVRLSIPIIE